MSGACEGGDGRRASADVSAQAISACATFTLYALGNWLLTSGVFPIGTAVESLCRDAGTLVEALAFLALALVSSRRPAALGPAVTLVAPIALMLVGSAALWLAAGAGSTIGVVAAMCAVEPGAVPATLAAGCALAQAGTRHAALGVLGGLAVSYLVRPCLAGLPSLATLALLCACWAGSALAGLASVHATLAILRGGESPDELAVTNPFSFLPRTHPLFVCLLIFRLAYGMALSFGEVDDAPLETFAGLVSLVLVAVFAWARRRMPRHDTLFGLALLLVMAGLMFATASRELGEPVTSNLLEAGSSCFMLVFWSAMAALARRNRVGAVPLIAWSGFLLGFGVIAGAAAGRACYELAGAGVLASTSLTSLLVLGLAAYGVFGLRRFSFDETIERLTASPEVAARQPAPDARGSLAAMADRRGLTARESEVFALLAQGRDGGYIQRQLGVSYNTVKTHVAHVYAKFDVHSHQELIDLVEAEGR